MRTLFALSLAALSASAFANSIFIENHSFEDPTLSSGSFFYSPTPMPGWSSNGIGGADRGIWNTTAPGKDGANIAFAYRNSAFAQQLGEALQADTIYTLDYLLGRTNGLTTGSVELWAGGTVADGAVTGGTLLASRTEVLSSGQMNEFSFSFDSTGAGPSIGQLLSIRMAGTTTLGQSYVSFDNARLTSSPVPEPGAMAAAAAGLGLLAARRRRKA